MNDNQVDQENALFFHKKVEEIKDWVGVGEIKQLFKPQANSQKEQNGQLTIIGGSTLFHGAPLLALTVASRIVDMVFFSGPKDDKDLVSSLKKELYSFIWIPEEDIDSYIAKSDAILIGPGLMRYHSESDKKEFSDKDLDAEGLRTKNLTENLLRKFPHKKWIIDAGSLQTMEASLIPQNSILTPNSREFSTLFHLEKNEKNVFAMAQKYNCIIVNKGGEASVSSLNGTKKIGLPQPGLTKGGTGDVTAGVIAALACKNDSFLAACAGTFLVKYTALRLSEKVGDYYNADDIAKSLFETMKYCQDWKE